MEEEGERKGVEGIREVEEDGLRQPDLCNAQ